MSKHQHCADVRGDRALGQFWEDQFARLAMRHGKMVSLHQLRRSQAACATSAGPEGFKRLLLPDITVWSAPGEHHEIKHKAPTDSGCFGLEDYRLQALKAFADETKQPVYYTIHRWDMLNSRDDKINRLRDWWRADVAELWDATKDGRAKSAWFPSFVDGKKKRVPGWFWPSSMWSSPAFGPFEMYHEKFGRGVVVRGKDNKFTVKFPDKQRCVVEAFLAEARAA